MQIPQSDLDPRQWETVHKLQRVNHAIVWYKIGHGKTRIALAWATLKQFSTVLVICSPNAKRQWQDEANLFQWSPSLKFQSYATLHKIQPPIQAHAIIVDELWLFKNPRARRTVNLAHLTHTLPTLGLSGSLVTARNIEDIYGQAFATDINFLLAPSLTQFRTRYCTSADTSFGMEFYPKPHALERIQERLAPHVDIYFPKDTRESRIIPTRIDPTPRQSKLLSQIRKDYFAILGPNQTIEPKSASALISKIQQVSDGAIYTNTGDVAYIESAKFRRLLELCKEFTDASERAIIWFAFKSSLNRALAELGNQATALSSDHTFDSKGWKNGKFQFTLATVGSGASLDDFANTERAVFYSLPFSPIAFQQAKGRTNRKSTRGSIAYYHILTTNQSIDQHVFNTVDIAGRIEQSIIRSSSEILQDYMNQQPVN